ncbi:AMP-binding protein [Candidatus Woesearchaeota archaeon]|nr:AMP-binding protein [Candidatus Woesearchaeota archaeon]
MADVVDISCKWRAHPKYRSWHGSGDIPIVTREHLASWSITDCPVRPRYVLNTSGSEGAHKLIFLSSKAVESQIAQGSRLFLEEIKADDVVGSLLDNVILDVGFDRLLPAMIIHCGVLTEHNMDLLCFKLESAGVSVLVGFVSHVFEILKHVDALPSLRLIMLTGGKVTRECMQFFSSKVPTARVRMFYAATEVGIVASQADDGWFHVLGGSLVLEVRDDNGRISKEGVGDLLITDLMNESMPIVRYLIGDRVELRSEGSVRLIKILGRSDDQIKIWGDVCSKDSLAALVESAIGHPEFSLELRHAADGVHDEVVVCVAHATPAQVAQLRERIATVHGVDVSIVMGGLVHRTTSGKIVHVVDCRNGFIP